MDLGLLSVYASPFPKERLGRDRDGGYVYDGTISRSPSSRKFLGELSPNVLFRDVTTVRTWVLGAGIWT